ncbi:MAG TPA: helix-turn-helix domain-containing protein [Chitinophagaceae bacterium]|nr:helix-turn-helix domain-containing protein [Chitinophagaceae bacterium]
MKTYDYDCPIEATLGVIGGKWKAIIIYYLMENDRRFTDLVRLLETVSARMLSKQLQELERDGIVSRNVFAEVPPRVEYALTTYGKTLLPLINAICAWGEVQLERTGKKAVYN